MTTEVIHPPMRIQTGDLFTMQVPVKRKWWQFWRPMWRYEWRTFKVVNTLPN